MAMRVMRQSFWKHTVRLLSIYLCLQGNVIYGLPRLFDEIHYNRFVFLAIRVAST